MRPGRNETVSGLVRDALSAFVGEDFATSERLLAKAKDDAPRSARLRELLGLSLYRQGKWSEALRELSTYKRFTGRKDQNHVIADCYRAVGRTEKAMEVLREVKREEVPPEVWTEVVIVGASTFADSGHLNKAIAHLSRAELQPKKVEPHHLRLWYVRSDMLERAGRDEEAKAVWEAISAEDPEFFDVSERLERLSRS
ncbi:MAG: tetratricopeptide repeat protein [Actinomycetota bacterium]